MDIVVANSGTDNIGIFLSTGNITFANQQTYSTGLKSNPYSITVKDFNNDNNLDIAVANYDVNNIVIFLGNGNGTFSSQNILFTGSSHPLFISTGDFNNDNYFDIAVVHAGTNSIGIFLGHGNGYFDLQTIYSTGYDSRPYSLAIADFDKDNQLDIAVTNYGTDNIGIFLGYGNGTFVSQKIYSIPHNSNPSSIAVGDLNNDNQLDIVFTNYAIGSIGIFLGYGNGSFSTQTTYTISSKTRPQFIAVGYFNKDNHLDVAVVDAQNGQIYILPGDGNGGFTTITIFDSVTNAKPFALAVTDFDNDNQSDIAVVNYGTNDLYILSGYSMQPSARPSYYYIGHNSRPSSVVVYDFTNDGILDIAVDNFNDNYILILNGIGDGTFVNGESYPTGDGSTPQHQSISDLNNDNKMDMLISNIGTDCIGVLYGQGNGTFAPMISYSTGVGSGPWFAAVGDVNNDNLLDIVSANTGSGTTTILLGYGNGTFINTAMYSTGTNSNPYSVALGDFNHDNYLDMAFAISLPDSLGVFLGYGNGTFGMLTNYVTGIDSAPFMVVLADFNRDNNLDAVTSNENSGNLAVFLGNGDGTFREATFYQTGSNPGSQPYYVASADVNNDNFTDLLVTNWGLYNVQIYFGDGNGNFELARTYPTGWGSAPYAITSADLNNDNRLEFIVSYWGNGYVSILTQYYVAEFAYQTIYQTGSAPHPYSLAAADFDQDNRSDIVVANSDTDDLTILRSLGNGSFSVPIHYPIVTNAHPLYVFTGDINKDHYIDIVSINYISNTMSVRTGYGNGTFAPEIMYPTGDNSYPRGGAMSDFNNDGRMDLVVANSGTDNIGILLGFNYASFQSQKTYLIANTRAPNGVVVIDLNYDNYLDLAVVFRDSCNLSILLGGKNGSFSYLTSYSTGYHSFPSKLAVTDFNNDTYLDIVVANYGADTVSMFFGYGNGTFANMTTYSTGLGSAPIDVAVGDFNNDGLIDITTANNGNNNMAVLLRYANGSYSAPMIYPTGSFSRAHGIAVDDLNNDGQLDIAVVNYATSTVSIFLGYGNGTFPNQVLYSVGDQSWPWVIVVADFNKDNNSDVAVANFNNNNVGVLLGIGNGLFGTVVEYSSGDGSTPEGLAVGDFNNDNILDIAVGNNAANTVIVLFGFGDGTFLLGSTYTTGIATGPNAVAAGDFNNDTRLDIVVCNYLASQIGIFFGDGYESFAGVATYTTGDGSQPYSVSVADFNNDGQLDIAVPNYGTNNVGILLGNGHGIFNTMTTYSTGLNSAPSSLAITDFNNDSQSDIVVTNSQTDNIMILLGYSNGTFMIKATYSTGARSSPYAVSTGDLNNDNKPDLVIANSGTSIILMFYGDGNGNFGDQMSYQLGFEYTPFSIAIIDLNQDNWMDIVIACYGTDKIEIFIKMC